MHITLRKTAPRKSIRSTRPSPSRSNRPATPAPRKKAVEEDDEHDSLLKVEGVITSMVRILEHFTVRDRQNNKFVRLTWTPKTRFVRAGKSAKSNVLRVGQPVKVCCDLADKRLMAEVVNINAI
ncbi:MAG: hypothetical protein B9S32_17540 [Verrucomicrobia bacterium Tous-C9LFEB]|nr:MAG: hypothetical protein B9S32_17540 [Verrucomicrobia bacterium Tous-C9LFEB]